MGWRRCWWCEPDGRPSTYAKRKVCFFSWMFSNSNFYDTPTSRVLLVHHHGSRGARLLSKTFLSLFFDFVLNTKAALTSSRMIFFLRASRVLIIYADVKDNSLLSIVSPSLDTYTQTRHQAGKRHQSLLARHSRSSAQCVPGTKTYLFSCAFASKNGLDGMEKKLLRKRWIKFFSFLNCFADTNTNLMLRNRCWIIFVCQIEPRGGTERGEKKICVKSELIQPG